MPRLGGHHRRFVLVGADCAEHRLLRRPKDGGAAPAVPHGDRRLLQEASAGNSRVLRDAAVFHLHVRDLLPVLPVAARHRLHLRVPAELLREVLRCLGLPSLHRLLRRQPVRPRRMCAPHSSPVCAMRVCSDGIGCMQTSSARASVAFARTVSPGASCGSGSRSKVRCWKTVRSTGSQARCAPLSTHHAPCCTPPDAVATWWQCARCQEAQEMTEAGYSGVWYATREAPIEPQPPVPGSEPAPVSAQRARLAQAAERAVIADRPATSRPLLQEPLLGEPAGAT